MRSAALSGAVIAALVFASGVARAAPPCVAILSTSDDPLGERLRSELTLAGDDAEKLSVTEPLEIGDLVVHARELQCERAIHVTRSSVDVWEDVLTPSPRLIETRERPASEAAILRVVELVVARRSVPADPPTTVTPAAPAPPRDRRPASDGDVPPNGVASGARTAGSVLLVASYAPVFGLGLASFVASAGKSAYDDHGIILALPVAGPLLYVADVDGSDRSEMLLRPHGGELSATSKALLYASAAGQLAGLALIGVGEIVCATDRRSCTSSGPREAPATARWRLFPMASSAAAGVGFSYERW